jgi:hypothetical protein
MSDALAASKPSIHHQIAEVRRELAMRANVYPNMIARGKMKQAEAQLCTVRMESVLSTLEFMRDHRALIIKAVFPDREGSPT